jgi:hypothetical protein
VDLVFAAVYHHTFPMMFVDELLDGLRARFMKLWGSGEHPELFMVPIGDHYDDVYEKW